MPTRKISFAEANRSFRDTAIVGMKKLNSSLESVVEVGQDIDGIAECWKRVNESLVSLSSSKKLPDANARQE